MIIASGPNFTSTYRGVNAGLAYCLNSVLNVKAAVGAFNQEKALVGAFSVIVKTDCETQGAGRIPLLLQQIEEHSNYPGTYNITCRGAWEPAFYISGVCSCCV